MAGSTALSWCWAHEAASTRKCSKTQTLVNAYFYVRPHENGHRLRIVFTRPHQNGVRLRWAFTAWNNEYTGEYWYPYMSHIPKNPGEYGKYSSHGPENPRIGKTVRILGRYFPENQRICDVSESESGDIKARICFISRSFIYFFFSLFLAVAFYHSLSFPFIL